MNHKLKGYTIPELLIAMLLSSIVLIAVLYGFQLIGWQLISTQKKSLATTDASILYATLKNDFNGSDSILQNKDTLFFYKDSLTIRYYTDSLMLIRQHYQRLDTLSAHTKLTDIKFDSIVENYITAVSLCIDINGKYVNFHFEKKYNPATIFEVHSSIIEKKWASKYKK